MDTFYLNLAVYRLEEFLTAPPRGRRRVRLRTPHEAARLAAVDQRRADADHGPAHGAASAAAMSLHRAGSRPPRVEADRARAEVRDQERGAEHRHILHEQRHLHPRIIGSVTARSCAS